VGAPSIGTGALASALLEAADHLNAQLVAELSALGWPAFTRTRSLAFRALAAGVQRPAALARELDLTRQSVQKLLDGLERDGLIGRAPDPDDARAQVVHLTTDGQRMLRDAGRILVHLEVELERRIGRDDVGSLRRIVGAMLAAPDG
jgi:DNA-binding MarR family transcriptional regulator